MEGAWLQSYNEAVFLLFQATLLCNGNGGRGGAGFTPDPSTWPGELSNNYAATTYLCLLQLSMSIATMEEEIVGVSVRLNQAIRQQFPKHRHS